MATQHTNPTPQIETPDAWCARVLALLDEQWRAFEHLATLAVTADEGADEGADAPGGIELLGVIDARAQIIEQIEDIDAKLVACQPDWDSRMAQLELRDRGRIHDAIAAVARLADRITEKNKHDRAALESRRDAIADELVAVSRGKSAAGAYAGSTQTPARFQDRQA